MNARERRFYEQVLRHAYDYMMNEDNGFVHNHHLCAMIVKKNQIISIGINKNKTHPLQAKFGKNKHAIFLHAEINAIINSLRHIPVDELKKCTLYVGRVLKSKKTGLARPCIGCQQAIFEEFQIKKVIFSSSDGPQELTKKIFEININHI